MPSGAVLKKEHLKFYNVIEEPCTAIVTVANTVKPEYLIEDGSASRFIVNLRVATKEGFDNCLDILGDKTSCAFNKVSGCFLAGTLWVNEILEIEQLPTKGEQIIATFDIKNDELRCVSLTLLPRKKLNTFDLNAHLKTRYLFRELIK